jgi:starch-binding outer membrane protein, SusD/RagB family
MRTMKKIQIIIAIFVGLAFFACEDSLEFNPKTSLSDETALVNTEGLQNAILGVYHKLQSGDLYGGRIWTSGDLLSDNVKKSGQSAPVYEEIQMLEKNMSPDNRITSSLWSNSYNAINQINAVLEAMPNVVDEDIADARDLIAGEAYFLRGMLYFDLMRYFENPNTGEAVPLLTETTGIDGQPFRATSDEVYTQILVDLDSATVLLPESNDDRATSLAAYALLSRVYFYMEDWTNCEAAATTVIGSGNFELADSVQWLYMENSLNQSDEIIFALMSTQTDGSSGTLNDTYRKESSGRFIPSDDLFRRMSTEGAADQRLTGLFRLEDGKWFTSKFDDRYMNVPLIRLAEIYLNRAEARFHLGTDPVGALADLNMVHERAGLDPLTAVNENFLYYERTKELFFEGDNFHNMRRLGMVISEYDLEWNSLRLVYKIPQRERDVNPNLTQNE